MNTAQFKTQSEIKSYKMPKINGNNQYKARTIVALDGGYSSVKGLSSETVFCFPSYAKKVQEGSVEIVGTVGKTDIQLRDNNTGEIWLVGSSAESQMDNTDAESITDNSLYSRYRYDSDIFRVIMMAGMGLGLWGTAPENEIFLQTGLPAKYKESDTPRLIKALKGNHDIDLKVGSGDWQHFKFTLDEHNIGVMEQPAGTHAATVFKNGNISELAMDETGRLISPDGRDIRKSNCVILDIGFGTEDVFSARKGYKGSHQTYTDTAMKSVFEDVIRKIKENYDTDIKIFELQKYLETGEVPCFNQDELKVTYVPIAKFLEDSNKELCEKSIKRLLQDYGNLLDYKYLIVTGGTGESRFEQIKERLSGLTKLTVLNGNINTPDLPFIYSNVVGYYNMRLYNFKKTFAESEK